MPKYGDFFRGIGKSRADQTAFDNMVNLDPHSEIGFVSPQLALTSESTTPTEACIMAVTPSGTVYLFSTTTGKVWKRATNGTYSALTANANDTGHRGAKSFNGIMYYWTASKLGKFTNETEGSRNDSFGTFSNSSARGCEEANLSLFIADGKYIASVDNAGTFSANVLDLPADKQALCIKKVGTDILIGTIIGSNVNTCSVYLWDTYSSSWTLEDELPENGVNCFIDGDNVVIAQCGSSGALYYWNGSIMQSFTNNIRGVTTGVAPFATTVFNKRPTFVVGNTVFTVYRQYTDAPYAVVQEYTATQTTTASIVSTGSQLLVSHGSGVDKLSTSYATGYVITPETSGSAINKVEVDFDSYGAGVSISTNSNGAGFVAKTTLIDAIRGRAYIDGSLKDSYSTQAKITLTPSGANVPKIKSITLE